MKHVASKKAGTGSEVPGSPISYAVTFLLPPWHFPLRFERGPVVAILRKRRAVVTNGLGRGLDAFSSSLEALGDRVVLFRMGDLLFATFGLFAALGAATVIAGAGVLLAGEGFDPRFLALLALGCSVSVVAGSWLAGQLLDYRMLLRDTRTALRRPVFVSWGGLLGLISALVAFAGFSGFSVLLLLDGLARVMPLGHALGRLGCLSYGCCFGRPTSGPVAITYRNPQAKAVRVAGLSGVPLHPAAFYEAVLDMGILVAANLAAVFGAPLGVPTALVLFLYGGGRFGIEFLRDNNGRIVLGCLSVNHLVCLSVAAAGGLAWLLCIRFAQAPPPISWAAVSAAVSWICLAAIPSAILIFFAFGVHRRQIGRW